MAHITSPPTESVWSPQSADRFRRQTGVLKPSQVAAPSWQGRLLARQLALPRGTGARGPRSLRTLGSALLLIATKMERLKQLTLTRGKRGCPLPCSPQPVTVLTASGECWASGHLQNVTPWRHHVAQTRGTQGARTSGAFAVRLTQPGQQEATPRKTRRPAMWAHLSEVPGLGHAGSPQAKERTNCRISPSPKQRMPYNARGPSLGSGDINPQRGLLFTPRLTRDARVNGRQAGAALPKVPAAAGPPAPAGLETETALGSVRATLVGKSQRRQTTFCGQASAPAANS